MTRILFAIALALAACRGKGEDTGKPADVSEIADDTAVESDDSGTPGTGELDSGDTAPPDTGDDTGEPDDTGTVPEPFEIAVEIRLWTAYVEGWSTCSTEPTLDYVSAGEVGYGETLTVTQYQSWPVYITWASAVPVTVPALGLETAEVEGEAWFNPWQDLDIKFCSGSDCATAIEISTTTYAARGDCVSQTIDGMYESSPDWTESMGESYGVSNMDSAYSSHYSCTDWAPSWACPSTDDPNEEECDDYGCECNLDPWTRVSSSQVRYSAATTAGNGVSAPWFTDRWETGGLHGANDGATVFRMYTEVSLSVEEMIFRPVIDMRTDWDGEWGSIPGPDGWEGPPLFRNAVNDYIAPVDGFWPIEWEANPTDTDLWMQPVWNIIVRPGAESGTADLRNLAFQACGSSVAEIECSSSGCEY